MPSVSIVLEDAWLVLSGFSGSVSAVRDSSILRPQRKNRLSRPCCGSSPARHLHNCEAQLAPEKASDWTASAHSRMRQAGYYIFKDYICGVVRKSKTGIGSVWRSVICIERVLCLTDGLDLQESLCNLWASQRYKLSNVIGR